MSQICPHCGKKMGKPKKKNIGPCEAMVPDYFTKKLRPCQFKAIKKVNGKKLCGTHIRFLKED